MSLDGLQVEGELIGQEETGIPKEILQTHNDMHKDHKVGRERRRWAEGSAGGMKEHALCMVRQVDCKRAHLCTLLGLMAFSL